MPGEAIGLESLARYAPRISAEWDLDTPGAHVRMTDASLVFVDISGFTNLSERLARRGRIGAEELTEVLNRVFGTMLDLAYARGGALLKFGGDALLLVFESNDHPVQAASAAVEMRAALRAAAMIPTSVGRVPLRMSVGVHSGLVHMFRVGSLHHELVVTGPAASRTTQMEGAAAAGEIFMSPEAAARLPHGATAPSAPDDPDAGFRLRWRRAHVEKRGLVARRSVDPEAVASCLPAVLRAHLRDGVSDFEHRVASVGFVKFKGVDAVMANDGADAVAKGLDEIVSVTLEAAAGEGVAFLASDIDEDGGKLILVSGVPTNQADDEGRMLRAARRIADHRGVFHTKIGVNRGHVFAGTVGAEYRATYTVMGDTVNLAARLMAAAPPGAIYATAPVLERSRTRFDVEAVPPFMVKGKSAPVHAFAVGAEAGDRTAPDDRDEAPFVGRTAELGVLVDAIARAATGAAEPVEVIGDSGMGKSRLLREAVARGAVSTFVVRGEPTGTATPYRALREPLRALLDIERGERAAMASALRTAVRAADPDLGEYVPLVAAVAGIDAGTTETVDTIDARFRPGRTSDVLIRLLDVLLPSPRAIVVEDAQWTDAVSDYVLERLVGAANAHSWAVITARRTGTTGFVPAGAIPVTLEPLPDSAVRDIVVRSLDNVPLRPQEIDAIVARAAGSPLFADELIGVVRKTGSVEDMPDSLEAAVNAEIDRLEALPRALLRHAAVLGLRFRPSLLRAVLADASIELDATALDGLDEYLERDGRDSLRFRQAVLREAAYAGLPYRRRRDLHLRAGQTIEELALLNDSVDREAASLSFHFAAGGDHERTWRYARMAGAAARVAYANVDAAAQYRRALDAARRMNDLDEEEVAKTWTALGDALEQAGVLDDALDAYRRALRVLGDEPVAKAALLVKRARARERGGAYRAALRELTVAEQLLDGLESDAADRARLRITTRRAIVRKSQERARSALALAQEGVAEAERLGEKAELARAYLVLDWAYYVLGEPERAVHQPLVVQLNEELGEIAQAGGTIGNQGAMAYWAGHWDEALDCYRRSAEACARGGDVVLAALEQANIGELLVSRGEFDAAAPVLADALRTHRATAFIEGALFDEVQLGRLAAGRGDLDRAIEMLTVTRDEATRLSMPGSALEAAVHLGSALVRAGRPEEALDAVDTAAAAAGEEAQVFAASVALVRARALEGLGALDDALETVTIGVDAARETGIAYELGRLLVLRASLSARIGVGAPDDDRVEGEALLDQLRVNAGH
jgi:class 3 adenylate cyclase/tetratricopeptide (TPR) repeat protein